MSPVTRTGGKNDSNQEELQYCENSVTEMSEDVLKELQQKCEDCEKELLTCDQSFQELNLQLETMQDKQSEEIEKYISDHVEKLESEYLMHVKEVEGLKNLEIQLRHENTMLENTKQTLELRIVDAENYIVKEEKLLPEIYQLQHECETLHKQNFSLETVLYQLDSNIKAITDSNSILNSKLDSFENIKLLKTKEIEELKAELEVQENDFQTEHELPPPAGTKSLFDEVDETLADIDKEYKELVNYFSGLKHTRAELHSRVHEIIFEFQSLKMNASHIERELKKFHNEFDLQIIDVVSALQDEVIHFEKFVDNGGPKVLFPETELSYREDMINRESKLLKEVDEQILSLRSEQLQINENIAREKYKAYKINKKYIALQCNNLIASVNESNLN